MTLALSSRITQGNDVEDAREDCQAFGLVRWYVTRPQRHVTPHVTYRDAIKMHTILTHTHV